MPVLNPFLNNDQAVILASVRVQTILGSNAPGNLVRVFLVACPAVVPSNGYEHSRLDLTLRKLQTRY